MSTNRYETEQLKITVPIYVAVPHDTAKSILEILRSKTEVEDRQEGSLRVATATLTREQSAIESRLRIDLFTLRHVLFNSYKTGMSLDLALRIQKELGDELVFINDDLIAQSLQNSLNHYKNYA